MVHPERIPARRQRMLQDVRAEFLGTAPWTGMREPDPRLMEAMATVPRERYVPPSQFYDAYENRALAIGHGQTISQPYIVALMTSAARPAPGDRVLELGTGSGYQAALLAELAREVFTVEIVDSLAREAASKLHEEGYTNVRLRAGDGWGGWPEHAPYDAILVTACTHEVPPHLFEQLAPGGRMVIPVGTRAGAQQLLLVEKDHHGRRTDSPLIPVAFVPLTGDHEAAESLTVTAGSWEHRPHGADVVVRGLAPDREGAFAQAALALTALVTPPEGVHPGTLVGIHCDAGDDTLLLVEWLNAVIREMSTRNMVFGRFDVRITDRRVTARAWGEEVDRARHRPAVEPKGATLTLLEDHAGDDGWVAQCVVDV